MNANIGISEIMLLLCGLKLNSPMGFSLLLGLDMKWRTICLRVGAPLPLGYAELPSRSGFMIVQDGNCSASCMFGKKDYCH